MTTGGSQHRRNRGGNFVEGYDATFACWQWHAGCEWKKHHRQRYARCGHFLNGPATDSIPVLAKLRQSGPAIGP